MTRDIPTRVSAGMKWLDRAYPDHVARVDLELLDVMDGTRCPLAQASGVSFLSAVMRHGLWHGEATTLGFDPSRNSDPSVITDAGGLTSEWRRQYGERIDAIAMEANEFQSEVNRRD